MRSLSCLVRKLLLLLFNIIGRTPTTSEDRRRRACGKKFLRSSLLLLLLVMGRPKLIEKFGQTIHGIEYYSPPPQRRFFYSDTPVELAMCRPAPLDISELTTLRPLVLTRDDSATCFTVACPIWTAITWSTQSPIGSTCARIRPTLSVSSASFASLRMLPKVLVQHSCVASPGTMTGRTPGEDQCPPADPDHGRKQRLLS